MQNMKLGCVQLLMEI